MEVCAIARLSDLLDYLGGDADASMHAHHASVLAYRQRYGVD
jgi:orotate phosphoribosyltransferase